MNSTILKAIEAKQYKKRPDVIVGDTVKLHMKIKEGEKERIQIFEGVVIGTKGSGIRKTITVRKMSSGVGVERIVPIHTPSLQKIEVVKRGTVRRSKLFYMRRKVGKRAMKVAGIEDVYMTDEVEKPVEESTDTEATAEPAVETEAKTE